ncbi:MAG: hypothetical protein IMY73_05280 [Bacteroidetes bacterium]|nr:hypothetical protein [Bacteroidota bacterium]
MKKITSIIILSSFTVIVTIIFLTGNIIPIEHGTHEGGITAMIGVAIILAISFLISFLRFKIFKK